MSDRTATTPVDGASPAPAPPAPLDEPATYPRRADLDRACDLIMKGGITSGIIYPHAVCELARTHRIVNVGGTSAGAIAAGGAAAAEVGRDEGGFVKLARLPTSLTEIPPGSRHTRLYHLFQAQPATAALYRFLAVFIGRGRRWSKAGRAALAGVRLLQPLPAAVGLLLPLLILVGAVAQGGWIGIAAAAIVFVLGALGAAVWSATRRLLRGLPANHLGLCSGMAGDAPDGMPPLTEWLADAYDDIAGKDDPGEPLTFGDLRAAGVELAMFTTDLTLGTQTRLPFTSRIWAFREEELRRLFPARVVDWMVANPPEPRPGGRDAAVYERFRREGYRPLPDEDHLPVIVGVRMSLSFPVLLSTVPLHAIDYRAEGHPVVPHRFSDGGITSNFPLQFFDRAIPSRPTFGIDLKKIERLSPDPIDNVSMPRSNRSGILGTPVAVESVGDLAGAVKNSMQNWADSMQTHVPGYRDRIVAVKHTGTEGGLNLDMDSAVVRDLLDRGRCAGQVAAGFDLGNHRWVRFRSFLQLLENLIVPAAANLRAEPPEGQLTFDALIDDPPSYASPRLGSSARNVVEAIEQLADTFTAERGPSGESRFAQGAPSPAPELQIKPQPSR
jgi:predicted acylesterase/phospholipase RssA